MKLTSAGLDVYLANEAAGEPVSAVTSVIGRYLAAGVALDDIDQRGRSR